MATMAQAKRDFGFGLIKGARMQRMFDSIIVELEYQGKASADTLDDARTKKARHFKTFDAAVRAIEEVGFSVDALRLL